MSEPFTYADLLATARYRTKKVQICARGDLVGRHAEVAAALEAEAQVSLAGKVDHLAEELVAIEEEQERSTVTFVMQSVSRRAWADLLAAHPPRKGDRGDQGEGYNRDTFGAAAVATCCIEPKLTLEDAQHLDQILHAGEWSKLWFAIIELNILETPHPKLPAATELVRANGRSLTTSGNGASLAGPSSENSGEQ